jgi:putative ABC transport system permease protein
LSAQIKEHFHSFKVLYGVLLILLIYIFVALFGTFWKIASKRTVEIGIRRAVGHSRGKVMFYILAEPMLLLAIVMVPATIVYINLYKIMNIPAPFPVYVISAGILLFVVLLATVIPSINAGCIHPMQALAEE